MANRHRGEIEAILDGRPRILCLTLGALARLETHFGCRDLPSLAARIGQGQLSSADLAAILHAGLSGGGNDLTEDEVAEMRAEGGAAELARIVARLLEATFRVGPESDEA